MTEQPHLLVTEDDSILIATFNRPEKLKAMSMELMALLGEAVARFRDTPEIRVMLIRATGRYFSAGADLKGGDENAGLPKTGSGIREMHRRRPISMRQIWDEMEAIEKPFAVAHQARCVGGSLEMSLSCDFRLAAASASYAFPEARFGVLPATNGVSHLVRQNAEMFAASKIAIELAADLPAHQAASVERLANSSLMLGEGYQAMMTAHVASIGSSKGNPHVRQ